MNALTRRDSVHNGRDDDGSKLIAGTLKGQRGKAGGGISHEETLVAHTLRAEGFDASEDGTGRGTPLVTEPYTLDWQSGSSGDESWRGKARSWIADKPGTARSLTANRTLVTQSVRRLTPVECERLQSFPDGWTLTDGPSLARERSYPHRIDESCPPPDGPRYAAMGDAVTVNVLEWIGRRLLARVSRPAERTA